MHIRHMNLRDMSFLGANLRNDDLAEIMCQFPDEVSQRDAAIYCMQTTRDDTGWVVVGDEGTPHAAFGFSPTFHPTLWSAWAFGDKLFPRCVPAITRHCLEDGVPHLLRRYAPKRIEVRALATHDVAHRWLRYCGFRHETRLPAYGKNGEDFDLYAWTDEARFWTFRENWYKRKERRALRRTPVRRDIAAGSKSEERVNA